MRRWCGLTEVPLYQLSERVNIQWMACDRGRGVARLGLAGDGEQGLKVGRLFFAIDEGGRWLLKTYFFQESAEMNFGEAKVDIVIEFTGLFEAVLQQVEDHEGASGFEDAMRFGKSGGGILGVVKRLREEGEVDAVVVDRNLFDFAKAKVEVGKLMLFGEVLAELDHLARVVDRDDMLGALGKKLRYGSFAGTEVGHHFEGMDFQERLR